MGTIDREQAYRSKSLYNVRCCPRHRQPYRMVRTLFYPVISYHLYNVGQRAERSALAV